MAAKKKKKVSVRRQTPEVPTPPYHSPDGIQRPNVVEHRINEAFAIVLGADDASTRLVRDYLRSVTIERIGGPDINKDSLMHLEGQRYLVGVIEQRIKHGREKKP